MLLQSGGRLWVGVGSDHTDREVETYGVTVSKQMCDKPIARSSGRMTKSRRIGTGCSCVRSNRKDGEQLPIRMAPLPHVAARGVDPRLRAKDEDGRRTLMFCGTLAAKGGVRAAKLRLRARGSGARA